MKNITIKDYFILGKEEAPSWMLEAIVSGYCDYFYTNNIDSGWISDNIFIHIVTMEGVTKVFSGQYIGIKPNGEIFQMI